MSQPRARHHPKGSGPSATQYWGFPSIYAYILCRRTTKGWGMYPADSTYASYRKSGIPEIFFSELKLCKTKQT